MKNILFLFSFLFCVSAYSQDVLQNGIIIDFNQNKTKQYIGISSNGKDVLSNRRHTLGKYETKGHYYGVLLTDFADALSEYIGGITIEEVQQEISDSISAISSGVTIEEVQQEISDSLESLPVLTSGSYTPTFTPIENVTSVTISGVFDYMRIGSVCHVSGRVFVDPAAGGLNTIYSMSLPISSDLNLNNSVAGISAITNLASEEHTATITGNSATNVAEVYYVAGVDAFTRIWTLMFQYKIN